MQTYPWQMMCECRRQGTTQCECAVKRAVYECARGWCRCHSNIVSACWASLYYMGRWWLTLALHVIDNITRWNLTASKKRIEFGRRWPIFKVTNYLGSRNNLICKISAAKIEIPVGYNRNLDPDYWYFTGQIVCVSWCRSSLQTSCHTDKVMSNFLDEISVITIFVTKLVLAQFSWRN